MRPVGSSPIFAQALACWNWKCALLSATARSAIYLVAISHSGPHGGLSVALVEMAYVTLTAGLYAGLQQQALAFRFRMLGNLTVVFGVPALAQVLDWLTHRAAGAAAPAKATLAVCVFAAASALFHLYTMRRGAFLTGRHSRSLCDDLRRMPSLTSGFLLMPVAAVLACAARLARGMASEAVM